MAKQYSEEIALFTAAITGSTTPYNIRDYQHIMLTLSSASSADFTIKFQGSQQDATPDFSAAQSNTNRRDYIQVKDYNDGSSVDWDTGVAFAGTDDVRQFEFNVNGLKWCWATLTAYAAGTVSLRIQGYNNL